jgi:hypothetical protein
MSVSFTQQIKSLTWDSLRSARTDIAFDAGLTEDCFRALCDGFLTFR